MKISYEWLKLYLKKLPKPEKVAEVLEMHAFEVESLDEVRFRPTTKPDFVFDISVLPNRAHDCLSHIGMAKEIAAILNLKPDFPKIRLLKKISKSDFKVEVKDQQLCRRYIGRIIEGVKVKESPKWSKERLEAIGQKAINNIVDATNFVMFETGQPLHAFDADKVEGKIFIRKAKKGEKITTLDNQEIILNESVLIIADEKSPLAIAGIKGGKKAEITKETKNIILEAANFESINIRKTSRKINLRTESSIRFENEISPYLAEGAMERLTQIILEIAGGRAGKKIDIYPKKIKPIKIIFNPNDTFKILGIKIAEKEIIAILKRLGISVKKAKNNLIADIPPERLDLNIKEDLIEEVARIYGYEKIPAKLPAEVLIPSARNDNYFYTDIIRSILIGAGFSEVYNYSFSNKGEIEILNPIAVDKKYLRTNLLDGLNATIRENTRYFKDVKIFEIGKIFPLGGETISLAVAGLNIDFYETKGVVEILFEKLGINDYYFQDHPNKTADIRAGNVSLGAIDHNGFEINFEILVKIAKEEIEYRPISRFPAVKRDISLYVPTETRIGEVEDVIQNAGGELLIDSDLFDIYENENNSRKSLAFHLIFQARDKTFSDEEINEIMNKIIDVLEKNPAWEVRKK